MRGPQKKPVSRAIARRTEKKRVRGAISPVDTEGGLRRWTQKT